MDPVFLQLVQANNKVHSELGDTDPTETQILDYLATRERPNLSALNINSKCRLSVLMSVTDAEWLASPDLYDNIQHSMHIIAEMGKYHLLFKINREPNPAIVNKAILALLVSEHFNFKLAEKEKHAQVIKILKDIPKEQVLNAYLADDNIKIILDLFLQNYLYKNITGLAREELINQMRNLHEELASQKTFSCISMEQKNRLEESL